MIDYILGYIIFGFFWMLFCLFMTIVKYGYTGLLSLFIGVFYNWVLWPISIVQVKFH